MRHLAIAVFGMALVGCPGELGFRGRVYAVRDPATLSVIPIQPGGTNVVDATLFTAVPGATISCEGCPKPVTLDVQGHFSVDLGMGYSEPRPIVLHSAAPGYLPVDIEVQHPGGASEAGYPAITIVMVKAPSAP